VFEQNINLTFTEVQNLSRPCVYIFWFGELCQYVGKSQHGILRPFSPYHERVGAPEFKYDRLEVVWQTDYNAAGETEKELIWQHSPQFNEQCVSWLPRRSSGVPMPHKSYDANTREFLILSETGKVVFRSKDKEERGRILQSEMTRYRKEQVTEFKRQAKEHITILPQA